MIDGATALALRHPPPLRGARPRPPLVRSTRLANLTDHLPERERPFVRLTLAAAWRNPDAAAAERSLGALARSLDAAHPGAAASLREGLSETLTITRLGRATPEARWRTLRSTNPVEQMFSVCRTERRNLKRWQSGDQALRLGGRGPRAGQQGLAEAARLPLHAGPPGRLEAPRHRDRPGGSRPDRRLAFTSGRHRSSTRFGTSPREPP